MAQEYKEKKITINLTKAFDKPVTKRAKSAKFILKNSIIKETRAKKVLLSNKINETLWGKGMYKTPRKITIKVINDKGKARVYLPDEKVELKKDDKDKKENKGIKAKVEEMTAKKENSKEVKTEAPEKVKEEAVAEKEKIQEKNA
jgi:ribosomal protein L31E